MESYFDLLGLPADYALDAKALEQAYFAAQRATHPDRFVGRPEAERTAAILKSQAVNEAYEALKNPLTRAEHLLELQGIFVNPEDGGAAVPPELLMEMMELRERLADAAQHHSLPIRGRVRVGAPSVGTFQQEPGVSASGAPLPSSPLREEGLPAMLEEITAAAKDCQSALTPLFASANWSQAARETLRLSYLMKALEEAHMHVYRLKAGAR